MAQEEKYGTRCRAYSAWHRRQSTRRFIGIEDAQNMAMIDLDASLYVEYDDATKEPLILIETARDVGQDYKNATVTRNLARACTERTIPVFVLLYGTAGTPNPADQTQPDIDSFRWRLIWPEETEWVRMPPEYWCKLLRKMRRTCAAQLDATMAAAEVAEKIALECRMWVGVWK